MTSYRAAWLLRAIIGRAISFLDDVSPPRRMISACDHITMHDLQHHVPGVLPLSWLGRHSSTAAAADGRAAIRRRHADGISGRLIRAALRGNISGVQADAAPHYHTPPSLLRRLTGSARRRHARAQDFKIGRPQKSLLRLRQVRIIRQFLIGFGQEVMPLEEAPLASTPLRARPKYISCAHMAMPRTSSRLSDSPPLYYRPRTLTPNNIYDD